MFKILVYAFLFTITSFLTSYVEGSAPLVIVCTRYCPPDQTLDVVRCQCLSRGPPNPRRAICPLTSCPNGCSRGLVFTTDQRGCQRCSCRTQTFCSPVRCNMFCPNGLAKDRDGCDVCSCRGPAVRRPQRPVKDWRPKGCGPRCLIHCPNGNVLDGRGCPTCRCNPGPLILS
ncbi:unnamed protein product [Lymnaea stagnalis]|uniref:Antistasin-like domain-containing protein n=1 Tax=Lymnaea stagnalis TaxID=6523 RepID=A0AAV2HX21_LYMST